MAKPWELYPLVAVETYEAVKPGKSSLIHVRPLPGQGYATSMDVECSRPMRKNHPIGTQFRIHAKLTDREGGKPFLYSHFNWPYEVIKGETKLKK